MHSYSLATAHMDDGAFLSDSYIPAHSSSTRWAK